MHVANNGPEEEPELVFNPDASLAEVVAFVKPASGKDYFSTIVW